MRSDVHHIEMGQLSIWKPNQLHRPQSLFSFYDAVRAGFRIGNISHLDSGNPSLVQFCVVWWKLVSTLAIGPFPFQRSHFGLVRALGVGFLILSQFYEQRVLSLESLTVATRWFPRGQ